MPSDEDQTYKLDYALTAVRKAEDCIEFLDSHDMYAEDDHPTVREAALSWLERATEALELRPRETHQREVN